MPRTQAERDPLLNSSERLARNTGATPFSLVLLLVAFSFLASFFFAFCTSRIQAASPQSYHLSFPYVPLTFIAIGDWGRKGGHGQLKVASAIAKTVNHTLSTTGYNPHYVLSVGDNFYKAGVSSVSDPHFKESYLDVYKDTVLTNVPWYVILGNHDHLGNIHAQVDYTAIDARWNMPATYYAQQFTADLIAIFLDTTPFVNTHYGKVAREKNMQSPQQQLRWLKAQLQNAPAQAKFLIVAHHNMYTMSTAGHLGSAELRQNLKPVLEPYRKRILAYVSGHEHSLMHMQPYGEDGDWVVDHFLSGAGSKLDDIQTPPADQIDKWRECCGVLPLSENKHQARAVWGKSVHGFFTFRYDGQHFLARAIDDEGNVVYTYEKTV